MNKLGKVSEVLGSKARVTLEDMDNAVTGLLPINSMSSYTCTLGAGSESRTNISVGDKVLVCFYNDNLNDGVIVAKI